MISDLVILSVAVLGIAASIGISASRGAKASAHGREECAKKVGQMAKRDGLSEALANARIAKRCG